MANDIEMKNLLYQESNRHLSWKNQDENVSASYAVSGTANVSGVDVSNHQKVKVMMAPTSGSVTFNVQVQYEGFDQFLRVDGSNISVSYPWTQQYDVSGVKRIYVGVENFSSSVDPCVTGSGWNLNISAGESEKELETPLDFIIPNFPAISSPYADIVATGPDLLVPLKYAKTECDGQILYEDSGLTTPVDTIGEPIGGVKDLDGNTLATQTTGADRPPWDGGGAAPDLAGDYLQSNQLYYFTGAGITAYARGVTTGTIADGAPFIFDQGFVADAGFGFGCDQTKAYLYTPIDHGGASDSVAHGISGLTAFTLRCEIVFGVEQRIYVNGTLISTAPITTTQITSAEMDVSDPARYMTQAKGYNPDRSFPGTLEAVLLYGEIHTAQQSSDIETALGNL